MTVRTASAPPRVAVSYAWKEETEGPNRQAVERFCEELRAAGVEVTRDQDDAEFGDDLMRFMCDIGHSDSLCVFMSKAYLESFCCMYEFLVAWCRSLDKPEEFQKRVHIWLMDDARIYADPAQRDPLIEVWRKRSVENKTYAEKLVNRGSLGEATLKHINRIQQIEHSIDAMVQHACDHLSPCTWQELATIVIAQHRVEEKRRADEVFENICTEINAALTRNRRAADLFCKVAPDLFGNRSLEIAALSKLRDIDGPACVLEPIYRKVKGNPVSDVEDRKAIRDLSAGILLLSVDPKWVLHQRLAADLETVRIPGREDVLRLPKHMSAEAREVSLLRLCNAALADSAERFHEIFDSSSQDGRRMPSLPHRMPVIGDRELLVIQQQVIRVVFGEFFDLSSLADAEVRTQFQNRYTEAVEAIALERNLYRTPYYTADPTWVGISTRIKGGQLRLKDLLLYEKPTEQPGEIFPKMVRNLTALWHIFDLLPLDN